MSMIDFVRRRKKGIVNFILLGLAVILMISFGLDSFLVQGNQEDFAIKIDSQVVMQSEYQSRLRSMEQLYGSQLKGMFDQIKASLNLPQKIADQIIEEKLLGGFINQLGLSASHTQIEERIARLPYFSGKIDQGSYINYLKEAGLSETALISSLTKEVTEGELNKSFSQLAPLSEDELKSIFYLEHQRAKFIAAKFNPQDKEIEVSAGDIEKYYNDHKQSFMIPKSVKLEYVLLSPNKYLERVPANESDLRQLYAENSSKYMEPGKILLSKISFAKLPEPKKDSLESTVSPNKKKEQLAQSVIERVKKGEDFGQLARELSEDKMSREKSGELGWEKLTNLSEYLRSELAEVEVGSTSGIIEDSNEFSVYYVNQRETDKQLPFETVKAALTEQLRTADAPLYLELEAEKLFSQLQSSGESLETFAKRESVEYKLEPLVSPQSLGISKTIKDAAFGSEPGDLRSISSDEGIYFLKVVESFPEHPKTLLEARADIISALKASTAKTLAKTKAEEFLKSNLNEKSISSFKKALSSSLAEIVESPLESLDSQKAEFLSSKEDTFSLYSLNDQKPVYGKVIEHGDSFYVVILAEKLEPDAQDYTKKRADIISAQAQKTSGRILDSLLAALRAESKIEINPNILYADNP